MSLSSQTRYTRLVHACLIAALSATAVITPTSPVQAAAPAAASQTVNNDAQRAPANTALSSARRDVSDPTNPVDAPAVHMEGTTDLSNIGPTQPVDLPPADAVINVPTSDARISAAAAKHPQTISARVASNAASGAFNARITYLKSDASDEYSVRGVSPVGVVFTLDVDAASRTAVAQSASREVKLGLDYSNVNMPFGGDFIERLALYEGHGCTFADDGTVTACTSFLPLHGYHDYARRQLVVTLDADTLQRWADPKTYDANVGVDTTTSMAASVFSNTMFLPTISNGATRGTGKQPPTPTPTPDSGRPSGPIIVLSSGVDGPTGDYGATPVGDVLNYQVGLYTGAAQINYPIPMPPSAAGAAPDVMLSYDSSSIDGSGIARSAQPGSVGIGWTQKAGAIVRILKKSPTSGSDQHCWTSTPGGDFLFSLNGISSRLVWVSGTDYKLSDDPRWLVQMLTTTNVNHPDNEKTYWQVTSPDGTKYRFGGEFEPETNVDQNSVYWLPMHQQATATSCVGSVLPRAWQWNIDRIEDPNGNVVSYFYEPELQYYNSNATIRQYVRFGQLKKIEYAKRSGTSVQPNARVLFHTEMRCTDPTTITGCDTSTKFPDTPTDFQCGLSSSCTKHGATFWTYRRLHAVQTQVYDNVNARWTTAGMYELNHSFPVPPVDPNNQVGVPKLWLNGVTKRPGGDYNWSPYNQIEAEYYDAMNGVAVTNPTDDLGAGGHVDTLQAGDWVRFDRVNFSEGASYFLARVWNTAAMNLEVRLDSPTAPSIATVAISTPNSTWKTLSTTVSSVSGVHDVYIYVTGANVNQLKLNWFRFNRASAPVTDIAPVQYGYVMLAGRVDVQASLNYQIMPRVMTVTNELGGVAEFTYGQSHTNWNGKTCTNPTTSTKLVDTDARPAMDCFRAFYSPDTTNAATMTWWKYKVLQLREWDTFSGNPVRATTYSYSPPTYAFYDDPSSTFDYWNEFRGHEVVTTTDALGVKVEHRFYRGLDGDKLNSSGGTFAAVVTRSDGTTLPDHVSLRGKEFETRVIASSGSVLDRSLTAYTYTLTAGSGISGSYFTAPSIVTGTTYGTVNKTTQTDTAYDSYGNVTQVIERGDLGTTADDRISTRSYALNTSAYIVDTLEQEKLWAGSTPGSDSAVLARSVYLYDGASWIGTAPSKGNPIATSVRPACRCLM